MTEPALMTADDLGDPGPTDLNRLTAGLELRAHLSQGVENSAAPSCSDICERVGSIGNGDQHLGDINRLSRTHIAIESGSIRMVVGHKELLNTITTTIDRLAGDLSAPRRQTMRELIDIKEYVQSSVEIICDETDGDPACLSRQARASLIFEPLRVSSGAGPLRFYLTFGSARACKRRSRHGWCRADRARQRVEASVDQQCAPAPTTFVAVAIGAKVWEMVGHLLQSAARVIGLTTARRWLNSVRNPPQAPHGSARNVGLNR